MFRQELDNFDYFNESRKYLKENYPAYRDVVDMYNKSGHYDEFTFENKTQGDDYNEKLYRMEKGF